MTAICEGGYKKKRENWESFTKINLWVDAGQDHRSLFLQHQRNEFFFWVKKFSCCLLHIRKKNKGEENDLFTFSSRRRETCEISWMRFKEDMNSRCLAEHKLFRIMIYEIRQVVQRNLYDFKNPPTHDVFSSSSPHSFTFYIKFLSLYTVRV